MTQREVELARKLEECQEALKQSRRENELLRQKIDLMARQLFGKSSERLDPAQLQLLLQLAGAATATSPEEPPASSTPARISSPPRKKVSRAVRVPENLPVVEEVIDPEPVKEQPQNWRCIGQEVSEQLDYEPGRFLRRSSVVHWFRVYSIAWPSKL
jgi:transposase